MLEGLLVDLVPYGRAFQAREHAWYNNESLYWASMGERELLTHAQLEKQRREEAESDESRTGVTFGVRTKDGALIGSFGINFLSPYHRVANLGAMINEPDYWGGGYGTDALLLLVDYAFGWLDMRRLWLDTMSSNARVLRQMQKVGFTLEARLRSVAIADGQWNDEVVFGLMRDEWPGREAMIARLGLRAR
ncbi:MAG TPA: GNAT family protein [Aggregatilineaceae bacterium]|nr:GNAT family protein [Aggregatilineaceae bacterium]